MNTAHLTGYFTYQGMQTSATVRVTFFAISKGLLEFASSEPSTNKPTALWAIRLLITIFTPKRIY